MNLRKPKNLLTRVFMILLLFATCFSGTAYGRTEAAASQQQKKVIRGSVKDAETNESLPGASILEKGTTNGTITDVDGNFSLQVNPGSMLQISYVSYKTQEISVEGREVFNILLEPDVFGVSDVVVIGYGTVKKSDLTGAVASISEENIRQNVGSGIDQALQGRTAGVTVTTNSGAPGKSPTVRIRGMGTITNPNPFYVIDGVPVSAESVGMLNPGDIESMEVLKDASAAAIYGARAANGVVLITTKKAKAGKSSVTVDAYTGVQMVAKKYDVMNGTDWTSLRNAAGLGWTDSSTVLNTDWQDEIFRQAQVSNMQVSFLNGSEKINSAIIASYYKQEGIIKGSDYERFTARINTTSNIKPWLTIGENIGLSYSTQNLVPEQNEYSSVVTQAITADPTQSVYNAKGDPSGPTKNNIGNPIGQIERNHNVLQSLQLLGNAYIEIKPFSWLSFKSSIGMELNRHENERFTPIFYESADNMATQTTLFNGSFQSDMLLFEQLLTLQKTFADKHNVQFLAGYTAQQSSYRLSLRQTTDVPDNPDMWFMANRGIESEVQYEDVAGVLNTLNFSGIPWDASMISYLARLIYSFDNRYDLTVSFRRDGSSKFGASNRWGNFPSFAAGWKINEESFFPKTDLVTFLKLRAGWGLLGNQEIGDYAAYTNVTSGEVHAYTLGPWGGQASYNGGAPHGYANQGVKWESTEQTNIGLDMNLFANKLAINFDYFIRLTNDMLAQVPVSGMSGIQDYPYTNAGSVSNIGFELNATFKNKVGDFNYSIGANIGHVKNEVTALGAEGQYIASAPFRSQSNYVSRTEVGMPIACFYGYITDGIYQNQEEIDALNEQAAIAQGKNKAQYDGRAKPGDVKMVDVDGDGFITANDQDYIGSPHPDFTYGINIDLEYKGFDLKVFGQGVSGNKIFQAMTYYHESGNCYWNLTNNMKAYWQQEGDQTSIPRLTTTAQNEANLRFSDRYVKDGSYFRIKSIQLGYMLPATLVQKIGIEQIRVYLNAQNFFSFHNYSGFDPEVGTGNNQGSGVSQRGFLDIGIDRGMYPLAKSVSLGLNLTF
ncbi:MAG TPA: TonB-dependent receptor [Prolixibacteraceae bacterium]|nr:TonB-dependent receptor [Prolixibacteraceae bacterium]